MAWADNEQAAAEAICRAMAARRDDGGWTMVNTYGFDDFPPEVKAWEENIGGHIAYPMCVLAAFATGQPIPEKDEEDVEL